MKSKRVKREPLRASTMESAVEDLRENGYFWLKRALPMDLCLDCEQVIKRDLGQRLDAGSPHQQEPAELLLEETAQTMRKLQSFVMNEIIAKLHPATASIPQEFTDTLYARVKRKHFHTAYHADAFNTIFERKFLVKENERVAAFYQAGSSGALEKEWSALPIYTFWVSLTPVSSNKTSHLRIAPGTHLDPTMCVNWDRKNVLPANYKYCAHDFVGPDFEANSGYEVGDIVVFHCLTLHEANAHGLANSAQERVSLDGRFCWQL